MNDEEFARGAFAAFRATAPGEPPTWPDADVLASRGRRAHRQRRGIYVAGTTALAGVVTVGVVTGPALLGLGNSNSTSTVGAAAGSTSASAAPTVTASAPVSDSAKPSDGTPCTPPSINWITTLTPALPAGVTATQAHPVNCIETPDGSRSIQGVFALSTSDVEVQVSVETGTDIAAKLGAGARATANDSASGPPNVLAQKLAAAASASVSASAPSSALAQLEAKKKLAAAAAASQGPGLATPTPTPTAAPTATVSASGNAPSAAPSPALAPKAAPDCTPVTPVENVCVTTQTKGPFAITEATLLRSGSSPAAVDVVVSNGTFVVSNDKGSTATPVAGSLPPTSFAVNVAEAVAAKF